MENHIMMDGSLRSVMPVRLVSGSFFDEISTAVVASPGGHLSHSYVVNDTIVPDGVTYEEDAQLTVTGTLLSGLEINAPGTGWKTNDYCAITGGTQGTPARITCTATRLISAVCNTPGAGYVAPGEHIVFAGGTKNPPAEADVASVKLLTCSVDAPGAGYVTGATIVPSGGTQTTPAQLTVASTKLISCALNAAGSGYDVADVITAAGGTHSVAATLTVASLKLASLAVNAAGGAASHSYVPGDTITLTGGTASVKPILNVTHTKVVSATVVGAGSGGTPGAATFTGTTGTGTKVQVTGTIGGDGTLSGALAVTVNGDYTVNPTDILIEPITGGDLVGGTIALVMGVLTTTIANAGIFSVKSATFTQFSSSGAGTGATFNTALFGVNTFSVTEQGIYTVESAALTQASVAPPGGTGATFQTASYGAKTVTVTNAGVFTTSADTLGQTSASQGSGATFTVAVYGVNAVTVTVPGTYTVEPSTLTQASSNKNGLSAGFNTLVFGLDKISITNAGVFTVNAATFAQGAASGSGVNATFKNAYYGVATVSVSSNGQFSEKAANPVAQLSSSGDGLAATFTLTYRNLAIAPAVGLVDSTGAPFTSVNPIPVSAIVTSVSGDVYVDTHGVANAADQSSIEGADAVLSVDLARYLRVRGKNDGAATTGSSMPAGGVGFLGWLSALHTTWAAFSTLWGALADAAWDRGAGAATSVLALFRGIGTGIESIRALMAGDTAQTVSLQTRGYPARVTSDAYVTPGVSGARTAQTLIGNSATAGLVVPLTFTMVRPKGRISMARAIMTPASSTLVYTNLDFDIVFFEAFANTPYAAAGYPANNAAVTFADNATARLNQLKRIGTFSFTNGAWRKGDNQIIGASVTGMSGTQKVGLLTGEQYTPFDLTGTEAQQLRAMAILKAAWNDGNVANNLDVVLDVDYD